MGKPIEEFVDKKAGELIRSEDWNALVAEVKAMKTTFSENLAKVGNLIAGVDERLQALQSAFDTYKAATEPVVAQFYRVSVQATKASYAIGELALLQVNVTDPRGGAVKKEGDSGPPWVDFVTTWGQLIESPGFVSIAGEGDRSISVQVNSQGIAQALLKSDHAVGFSKAEDDSIATLFATKPQGATKNIAELIVEAQTPLEAKTLGAFKVLSEEYGRKETRTMRNFADAYYQKYAPQVSGRIIPTRPTWRDYRATVMVFAKSDNDPTSADMRRGADSILVTFRDWISPWITLEYLDDAVVKPLIDNTRVVFGSKVTKNFRDTNLFLQKQVDDMVREEGLIGKIRQYKVIEDALDGLTVNETPDFLPGLTQALQKGVRVQHTLENAQITALAVPNEATAFQAITESITRADSTTSGVTTRLNELQGRVLQVDGQVSNMQTSLGVVSGRLDEALAGDGNIGTLHRQVETMRAQLAILQDVDPSKVRNTETDVRGISNNVLELQRRLLAVEGKVR